MLAAVAVARFAPEASATAPALEPLPGTVSPVVLVGDLAIDHSLPPTTVRFPAGAHQGPDTWWVGDLSIGIRTSSAGSIGEFRVSCGSGGYVALLMIFERKASGLEVRLHDLIDGQRVIALDGSSHQVRYRNFLRDQGVKPGNVPFTCTSEGTVPIGVDSVTIASGSRVYATDSSPTPVELTASLKREGGGDSRYLVEYVVRSRDARRLGGLAVEATSPDGQIHVSGARRQEFHDAEQEVHGRFVVESSRPGERRLYLLASTAFNSPRLELRLNPAHAANSWVPPIAFALGVVLLAAGARSLLRRAPATPGRGTSPP